MKLTRDLIRGGPEAVAAAKNPMTPLIAIEALFMNGFHERHENIAEEILNSGRLSEVFLIKTYSKSDSYGQTLIAARISDQDIIFSALDREHIAFANKEMIAANPLMKTDSIKVYMDRSMTLIENRYDAWAGITYRTVDSLMCLLSSPNLQVDDVRMYFRRIMSHRSELVFSRESYISAGSNRRLSAVSRLELLRPSSLWSITIEPAMQRKDFDTNPDTRWMYELFADFLTENNIESENLPPGYVVALVESLTAISTKQSF